MIGRKTVKEIRAELEAALCGPGGLLERPPIDADAKSSEVVESLRRKLLQSHRNMLPELFDRLLIAGCKLVNPARDVLASHSVSPIKSFLQITALTNEQI